jgi:excisionase family DNA binding protein
MQQQGVPGGQGAQGIPGVQGGQGIQGGQGPGAPADLLSPADVAKKLGVPEADVMSIISSGELTAKKIGTSYRITRAALDKYLSS